MTLRASDFHGASSSVPQGVQHLAAEEEIGGGVDVVGERQRLVDRLDAVALGIARVVMSACSPLTKISPASRL